MPQLPDILSQGTKNCHSIDVALTIFIFIFNRKEILYMLIVKKTWEAWGHLHNYQKPDQNMNEDLHYRRDIDHRFKLQHNTQRRD